MAHIRIDGSGSDTHMFTAEGGELVLSALSTHSTNRLFTVIFADGSEQVDFTLTPGQHIVYNLVLQAGDTINPIAGIHVSIDTDPSRFN